MPLVWANMTDVGVEVERILIAERQGKRRGGEIDFLCPAHPNTEPGPAAWNRKRDTWNCLACGAGGTTKQLAGLIGIAVEDKPRPQPEIVATYDYTDADGNASSGRPECRMWFDL